MFASGDMSVDSLIVIMAVSTICFWGLCGYQIITGKEITTPIALGTGFSLMMAAFAGGKTARDWKRGDGPGQQGQGQGG